MRIYSLEFHIAQEDIFQRKNKNVENWVLLYKTTKKKRKGERQKERQMEKRKSTKIC